MARYQGTVTIDPDLCKGCALCVSACPLSLISLETEFNEKGYYTAREPDERCTGCGNCALLCPETCIRVERRKVE
jgi:2-oxoglutarate ferredoxin oxidoreductase subunit delta